MLAFHPAFHLGAYHFAHGTFQPAAARCMPSYARAVVSVLPSPLGGACWAPARLHHLSKLIWGREVGWVGGGGGL